MSLVGEADTVMLSSLGGANFSALTGWMLGGCLEVSDRACPEVEIVGKRSFAATGAKVCYAVLFRR